MAARTLRGIGENAGEAVSAYLGFGLWMPPRARVTMCWPMGADVGEVGAVAGAGDELDALGDDEEELSLITDGAC